MKSNTYTRIGLRSEKIALARKLRAEGRFTGEIAKELGISQPTASAWTLGVLPYKTHGSPQKKKEVLPVLQRMYEEGIPITKIASITGIPAGTLYSWRLELGLPRNRRSVYVTDEVRQRSRAQFSRDPNGCLTAEAVRLYEQEEKSTPEIAQVLGVTPPTVSAWLKSAGIEARQGFTVGTREKLRQANLGSKRWNWKGGITPDRVRLRVSLDMKLAREACFKRDDYTCRDCGQRGGKLNAHHIWPFQSYPQLKFEVSNLLTLCKKCHDAFHIAAGGNMHPTIGPFLPPKKKYEVREPRATYGIRMAA
jgi:predicted transcriptional regulator